ncbi:NUDIX hydrolase [Alkalihalophilus pseudofirmus]|uniref:NUDIX hydrolase n=1 Tax=Alkalihalophilus pseudofirmus TaxID=79885 RepID=UPI0009F9535F
MDTEHITIVNEQRKPVGIASRADIHKKGLWHETFHCWMAGREGDHYYIYLQRRSDYKKDFPSLFDITAAGHISANETIEDGVREVHEELGIELTMDGLISLGVIKDCIISEPFIDREFAHVHLYFLMNNDHFTLQQEEVSEVVKAAFIDFYDFCLGLKSTLEIQHVTKKGKENKSIGKTDFVPHPDQYLIEVAKGIKKELEGGDTGESYVE